MKSASSPYGNCPGSYQRDSIRACALPEAALLAAYRGRGWRNNPPWKPSGSKIS
jgi:hypothetical protein